MLDFSSDGGYKSEYIDGFNLALIKDESFDLSRLTKGDLDYLATALEELKGGLDSYATKHGHLLVKGLLEEGIKQGRLSVDSITADDIAQSQEAGLRHRREGLAFRLWMADQENVFRPSKRVKANPNLLNRRHKKIMQLRMLLASRSHDVFLEATEVAKFGVFVEQMKPLLTQYKKLYRPTWPVRLYHASIRTVAGLTRPIRKRFSH